MTFTAGLPLTSPVRATGLLGEFAAAGVLVAADLQVARRLGRLGGEADEQVLLAAALAVRALRLGSVCVDLATVAETAVPEWELEPADTPDHPAGLARVDADGQPGLATADVVAALPWPDPASWAARCATSPMVATTMPPGAWVPAARSDARPLTLRGTVLYLDRYAQLEEQVRVILSRRASRTPANVGPGLLRDVLGEVFPGPDGGPPDEQRLAVAAAVTGLVTVVAGGPGTGKTWTVARLLDTFDRLAERTGSTPPRVALAAPTGKAAARLKESVGGGHDAATIHRLLGRKPGTGSRFRHDWLSRLPYDVVVVDETSMVSLELMARLLEALTPECRLVLVGDPDQLASVDAGAVLADLVARAPRADADDREVLLRQAVPADLPDPSRDDSPAAAVAADLRRDMVRLRHNHRSQRAIANLAEAIRAGDADAVVAALSAPPGPPSDGVVHWVDADPAVVGAQLAGLCHDVTEPGRDLVAAAQRGDAAAALAALGRHRLLCAHKTGPYGVGRWRAVAAGWLAEVVPSLAGRLRAEADDFYVGRPLLVTANDAVLRLWNGDTGVVVAARDSARTDVAAGFGVDGGDRMLAVFDRGEGQPPLRVPVSRLSAVQTPLAMTVHKAQGSEADQVTVVLPPPESPLLTRELLYTAVTRARHQVRVVGTEASVRGAVRRRVVRASGLRDL